MSLFDMFRRRKSFPNVEAMLGGLLAQQAFTTARGLGEEHKSREALLVLIGRLQGLQRFAADHLEDEDEAETMQHRLGELIDFAADAAGRKDLRDNASEPPPPDDDEDDDEPDDGSETERETEPPSSSFGEPIRQVMLPFPRELFEPGETRELTVIPQRTITLRRLIVASGCAHDFVVEHIEVKRPDDPVAASLLNGEEAVPAVVFSEVALGVGFPTFLVRAGDTVIMRVRRLPAQRVGFTSSLLCEVQDPEQSGLS